MKPAKNILAIEGNWSNRLDDKETIKSSLKLFRKDIWYPIYFQKG